MTRLATSILILLSAAIALPAAAGPARHAAPAARDWSQVATATPEGGVQLGNPAAKVRLIEFLSFTCPHCAAFEGAAVPRLTDKYVRTGQVSYEVRLALRDPFDLIAAVLARCDGPRRFFTLAPAIFAAQARWTAQASDWAGKAPDMSNAKEGDIAVAVLKGSGLEAIAAANGLPPARARACAANVDAAHQLAERAKAVWAIPGFPGTPAFMIDGALKSDIHDWPGLDVALGQALHRGKTS